MLLALPQLNDSQYSYSPPPRPVTSKFKRQNLFFSPCLKGPGSVR